MDERCIYPQNSIHYLRFRCYDNDATEYWAVLAVANFRGGGDPENMTLGNVEGKYARSKPKELLAHLQGFVAISQPPTAESIVRGPTIQLAGTQNTQDLLSALAASTQIASSKAASSPDSQRTNSSRPSTGGKFPRSQSPQAQPAPIDLGSDSSTTSEDDEGDSEEEIPSSQPTPIKENKRKPVPPTGAHPAAKLAQTTLGQMFPSAKRPKIMKTASEADGIDESAIKFSGSNLSLEAMTKFLETAFTANAKGMENRVEVAQERWKVGQRGQVARCPSRIKRRR